MKHLDAEVRRKVNQWLKFADEDLRLAKHGLKLKSKVPYRLIAYHAQQCAEKNLKAYLVSRGIDFPYTHNISVLLELCGEEAKWVKELTEAEELTPFAITTRYPGEAEEVTRNEALQSIKIATKVRDTVQKELSKMGLDISEEP
jgi:HEPN domain-containing protein